MLRFVCLALLGSLALAQMQPMGQPMGQPGVPPMGQQPIGGGFNPQFPQATGPSTTGHPLFNRAATTDETTGDSTTRGAFGSVTRKTREDHDDDDDTPTSTPSRLFTRSADSGSSTTRRPLVTRQAGSQPTSTPSRLLGGSVPNRPVTRSAQAGGGVTGGRGSTTPTPSFGRFTSRN